MVWELPTEEKAKQRGQALAESAHWRDVQLAREIARELASSGLAVSMDDVRQEMSRRFPDTVYGNWCGVVFRGDEWAPAGFIKSQTRNSHGNRLVSWILR